MSSISSVSNSSYASFTSSAGAIQSGGQSSAGPQSASLHGTSSESSAMFASFEASMQSGDPMRMLVAMLVMNLLLGENEQSSQKNSEDLMAGLVGLAMLSQTGASMNYSSSMTMAQQSAQGAYSQSVTASSSLNTLA